MPTANSASPSPTLRPATSPTPREGTDRSTPPPEFLGEIVGPWSATSLTVTSIGPILASDADSVYGRERDRLDRFDPSSGHITAWAEVDEHTDWPPLVTSHALWQTLAVNGTVTLQALDPRTLRELRSVRIATPTPTVTPTGPCGCAKVPAGSQWKPSLAAGADASTLFLANADRVYALDPASGAVEHQATVDGLVGGLAAAADGSRLYVAVNVPARNTARLLVLDTRHGLSTISDLPLAGGTVRRLLVTGGGVWATTNTGHEDNIRFAPLTDLAHSRIVSYVGALSATSAGGLVWAGGDGEIVCADASTGTIRDRAKVSSEMGLPYSFGSVQLVAGHWLAAYRAPDVLNGGENTGLATFTLPPSCR
ncbi:hypothetical protein [Jatrophihabitans sp.]|uniref:hypothetical protein n=1 Tax=Jatrophihabitans sp. TaxID=1932789 RepID=UPI002B6E7F1F|nr:hypothetical protein [Jatrophihabitans sp.]